MFVKLAEKQSTDKAEEINVQENYYKNKMEIDLVKGENYRIETFPGKKVEIGSFTQEDMSFPMMNWL